MSLYGQTHDTDGLKVLYAYDITVVRMLTHTATLKHRVKSELKQNV